jgi:O-antigen biosynthesis protein
MGDGFDDYRLWVKTFDTLSEQDIEAIGRRIARFTHKPLFSLLLAAEGLAPERLYRWVLGLGDQLYSYWELCITLDSRQFAEGVLSQNLAGHANIKIGLAGNGSKAGSLNNALTLASGSYVVVVGAAGTLAPHALYMMAEAINGYPDAALLYSDEDKLDSEGNRFQPQFKPEWNPDLLRSYDYFGNLTIYRKDRIRAVGGFGQQYDTHCEWDLRLRLTEKIEEHEIVHIPHVLYHSPAAQPVANGDHDRFVREGIAVLADALVRTSEEGEVLSEADGRYYRCRYKLPKRPPLVTIIIPSPNPGLLRSCLESIRAKTKYPQFELIVVDTSGGSSEMLAYTRSLRGVEGIEIFSNEGAFNWSAVNNTAAKRAQGDVLCFLNDDTVVIEPQWLEEMVSQAMRPRIGAVGAKLLYPDGSTQHGGFLLGIRLYGGHAHRHTPGTSPGYMDRASVVQNFSAVTGACMAIRKELFCQIGGFDERRFPLNYNDIELCLRLREAGYRIVWTPYALLYHYESTTKGADISPAARKLYADQFERVRIGRETEFAADPAFNPNLSLLSEGFSLAWPPRSAKPWIDHNDRLLKYVTLETVADHVSSFASKRWSMTKLARLLSPNDEDFIRSLCDEFRSRQSYPLGFAGHIARLKNATRKFVLSFIKFNQKAQDPGADRQIAKTNSGPADVPSRPEK